MTVIDKALEFQISKEILKGESTVLRKSSAIVETKDEETEIHKVIDLGNIKLDNVERITFVQNGKTYEFVSCY